jgi:hypothetical protein
MSVNKHRPHVLIVPEDDANRQIATGFVLHHRLIAGKQVQILPVEGGWSKVLAKLLVMQSEMKTYPQRQVVALVDFDERPERRGEFMAAIDASLHDRIFVLGAKSEPEALKKLGLGNYEAIGKALAEDCANRTSNTWAHPLLSHNTNEIGRMQASVVPVLF